MSESFVGLGHLVCFVALAHGSASTVCRIHELGREPLGEAAPAALAAVGNQPGSSQRHAALLLHFHRDLICRTTHPASFHFDKRRYILDCFVENIHRLLLCPIFHQLQSAVKKALSRALLSSLHHAVHETLYQLASEHGIRRGNSFGDNCSSWH